MPLRWRKLNLAEFAGKQCLEFDLSLVFPGDGHQACDQQFVGERRGQDLGMGTCQKGSERTLFSTGLAAGKVTAPSEMNPMNKVTTYMACIDGPDE